jgi:uncharacterized peroxidase-related enzyme
MANVNLVDPAEAKGYRKKLLRKVSESFGSIPNMHRVIANSEMVLDGFIAFNASIGAGDLNPKMLKSIILAASELNGCGYCAAAHTQMAKDAGIMNDEECLNARRLIGYDDKATAVLQFVKMVMESKGHVNAEDLEGLRAQGFTDANIVEALATIALTTFTNYISHVGDIEIDFPDVPSVQNL